MEARHQKKLDHLKGNKLFKSVDPIKFDNITSFIRQGKLQFKNPKNSEILYAIPTSVKATSNDEFSWEGKFEDGRGTILIMAQRGDIFGRFDIDNEVYEIHDLGGKKNILVKVDERKSLNCGNTPSNQNSPADRTSVNTPIINRSPLSCDNNVRILVLYTPTAAQFLNPQNIAAIGVGQLNTAAQNSGIGYSELSFTLAGTVLLPGFEEVSDVTTAMDNFEASIDAINLRRDYQADLVVLIYSTSLSANNDDGILGVARFRFAQQNGVWMPDPEKWRSIVSGSASSSFFAFQHEVGHLFGCNHENTPDFSSITGYPNDLRAKKFTTITCRRCWGFFTCCDSHDRQTIMSSTANASNGIPHYSNPNISFEGTSTGDIGLRNNAQLLKNYACHISNYVASSPPMTIDISGPNNCSSYEYYNWCANVNNCTNITNVNWEISTNGIDYSPFGYGSCIGTTLPNGISFCYLRVTATCTNGNSVTTYFPININQGGYYRANENGDSLNINSIKMNKSLLINDNDIIISPNPSSDKVQVTIKTEESDLLLVTLHDLTGKTIKNITNANVYQDVYQFEIDVKEFPNGIYLIRTQSNGKTITRKLIIQK